MASASTINEKCNNGHSTFSAHTATTGANTARTVEMVGGNNDCCAQTALCCGGANIAIGIAIPPYGIALCVVAVVGFVAFQAIRVYKDQKEKKLREMEQNSI